jgi:hypothetical protein
MQLRDLKDLARRRGFTIFREHCDQASGAKDSRPALDAMLTDARRGKFGAILIWKLDRVLPIFRVPRDPAGIDSGPSSAIPEGWTERCEP